MNKQNSNRSLDRENRQTARGKEVGKRMKDGAGLTKEYLHVTHGQ